MPESLPGSPPESLPESLPESPAESLPESGRPRRRTSASAVDPEIAADLDDLSDAIAELTAGDCQRLHAFWVGVGEERRLVAHAHAQQLAERSGRRDLIRDLQVELVEWGRGTPRGRTGWGEQWFDPDPEPGVGGPARPVAVPALLDATTALALQDLLDDADFEVLFGPWTNAMGDGSGDHEADDAQGAQPAEREPDRRE
jgi:hypothetical protein